MSFTLKVNGQSHTINVEPETPLLWVVRDSRGLTGTKHSCGIAECGACTLHVNGRPVRSCVTPASTVIGKEITTIEGLPPDTTHPGQQACIAEDAPQCGYCQSGQIMAAVALLAKHPNPSDADIDREMTNICRCGTYTRMRQAIHRAARMFTRRSGQK